jgi:hypothetical protein
MEKLNAPTPTAYNLGSYTMFAKIGHWMDDHNFFVTLLRKARLVSIAIAVVSTRSIPKED